MRRAGMLAGAAVALGLSVGCQGGSAKFVQKFDDGGVVAIKVDTPEAREKADKMVAEQYGAGYAVVKKETVSADGTPVAMSQNTSAFGSGATEVRLHYRKTTAGMNVSANGGVVQASGSIPSVLPGGAVVQAGGSMAGRGGAGFVQAGGLGASATVNPPAATSSGGPCMGGICR